MVAERNERSNRPPWEELSPGLRNALLRVLNDPPPEELAHRALVAARRQVTRYPRKSRSRNRAWFAPVVAVSIAWITLAGCSWGAGIHLGQIIRLPWMATPSEDVAAALSGEHPTAWTYGKAARQSPEALYALLDRRSCPSLSAGSPLLASGGVSPLIVASAGRTMTSPTPKSAITLEQLIALNDEIAALVRAGVPLDQGLRNLGEDLPGSLGRCARQLSERVSRGESLTDALAQPGIHLPRLYRAVVEAGVAAGRLPAALESLAGSLRRLVETRRSVVISVIYPLLLLAMAWGLFAFTTTKLAPHVDDSFKTLHLPGGQWFGPVAYLGRSARFWGPLGPVVLLVLACVWWAGSKSAAVAQGTLATWVLGWIPGLGRMLRLSRTAVFVEILKLLVENQVPLDRAATLAAEAAGDATLCEAAEHFAASVRRGEPSLAADLPGLPPLLSWLIAGGQRNECLLPALRHVADDYQRRAQYQAELSRIVLPIVITCLFSAVIVIAYTVVLLGPYYYLLRSLT